MSASGLDSESPVSRVEFEAALLRQEHRLLSILKNYFIVRPKLASGDPRRDAIVESLLWRISVALIPTVAAGSAGLVGVAGIVIAIWANNLISEQNATLFEQNKLAQSQIERLDKQNDLLTKQTENLAVQNQLAEASRRAAFLTETTTILNNIEEFVRGEKRDGKVQPASGWTLPEHLYGRISATSYAFRPYQYVRPKDSPQEQWRNFRDHTTPRPKLADEKPSGPNDRLIPQSLSPERAHLLISLVALSVDLQPLASKNVTFAYADCHDAELSGAILRGLDLRGADFSGANLRNADLRDAVFHHADFAAADLGEADCRKAFFGGAELLDNVESFESLFDKDSAEGRNFRQTYETDLVAHPNNKMEVFLHWIGTPFRARAPLAD
ncbi:MAG: pentapeptide repeat-containing protein [Planctomycetota bacterium]|nr:MAG: pentapeptide repeat-containing protein [Planctomycetota bacterium]